MEMKKLLKIAGVIALAGALLALTGFAMGARPSDMVTVSIGPLQIHSHHGLWNAFFSVTDPDDEAAASSFNPAGDDAPILNASSGASSSAASSSAASSAPASSSAPAASSAAPIYKYHSLEVDAGACSVVIQPGDDFAVSSNIQNYSVKNDDGKLEVESPHLVSGEITITVPRDLTLRDLEVSIGAGTLTVTDVSCEKGDFEVSAGEMTLENVTITRESSFEVGMGTLAFSVSLTGKTDIECGMGTVALNATRPADFGYEIEVGGGTVTLDGQTYTTLHGKYTENRGAATFFEIECGMGTVTVDLS